MIKYVKEATKAEVLRDIYRASKKKIYDNKKINFLGVEGFDVYNISKEFEVDGKKVIAGRVEKRNTEICKVAFFERINEDTYKLMPDKEIMMLQDPCVTYTNGELVIGGTEIFAEPGTEKITSWCTSFYKAKHLKDLNKFAQSPMGMKDVRFIEDKDGIHVFTRPQGLKGGLGKIGYIKLQNIKDLTPEKLEEAVIFSNHFTPDNWGGVNDIHILKNGLLGVVAHISYKTEGTNLHYYPCVFIFNPNTLESSQIEILLERKDLVDGPSKYPRLQDVIFTGGLIRKEDNKALLYMGTSDCEAQYALIEDPFVKYE